MSETSKPQQPFEQAPPIDPESEGKSRNQNQSGQGRNERLEEAARAVGSSSAEVFRGVIVEFIEDFRGGIPEGHPGRDFVSSVLDGLVGAVTDRSLITDQDVASYFLRARSQVHAQTKP